MMNEFFTAVRSSKPFREFDEALRLSSPGTKLIAAGVTASLNALIAGVAAERTKAQTLIVVASRDEAETLRDDCALAAEGMPVYLYAVGRSGSAPKHQELLDVSMPVAQMECLRALLRGERCIVAASVEALGVPLPPPAGFNRGAFEISAGSSLPFEPFLERLRALGFERKDFVEEIGDYAVRGGIVDVYPYIGEYPIRLEFWGDTVESIREFEIITQRSLRELSSASVVASIESSGARRDATLFDYLSSDAVIILDKPELLQSTYDEKHNDGPLPSWEGVERRSRNHFCVALTDFGREGEAHIIDVDALPQPPVNGSVAILISRLRELTQAEYTVYIAGDTPDEIERLKELLGGNSEPDDETALVDWERVRYVPATLHHGFVLPHAKTALLTEHQIFGRLKRRGTKRRPRFKGITQKELTQLRRGDVVVHEDYGIGRFMGLTTINVAGGEQEVMKLVYQDDDIVYVNLNFIHKVQKYASQEGHVPALTKLGTAQWERLTSKAKKQVKDIARKLIQLYARRKAEEAFEFPRDTHWQKEMEASFMYEDTPDQARATEEVKKDMENSSAMDRLICGDVGFGKTEVAVRAAFKAVLGGKQVAVLVPTTILALQHFNTFRDRLGRYGVRIGMLSRFRTRKEQKEVIEGLRTGQADIVIGTHRVLSRDVAFKDLGLLIIDEEHRFGVEAKEKLRTLKANVDTLTLTATPIPRTLQFSLLGARDLSLINTPPRNRLPIETEVVEFDLQFLREVIRRELARGGQAYVIHDKVHTMEGLLRMLKEHIPESRFGFAHGQMHSRDLEQTMLDFMERKYDVLVCTKIIESGIDIPSVNTIVINHAERFGLAELYQLRGRVGRSNEQAFAYLAVPSLSGLSRQALRRLHALQELTELGSGFNLAMRDLEIRGAGNLLGKEQSGYILDMGLEMYHKIVEEAVRELRTQEFAELFKDQPVGASTPYETVVEADLEALIPEVYIESATERLDIYRRLSKAEAEKEVQEIREELTDRFGEFPVETDTLLRLISLKIRAARAGFRKVRVQKKTLTFTFPPSERTEFYEAGGETASPFQQILENAQTLGKGEVLFRQRGNDFTAEFTVRADEPKGILAEASATIERLLNNTTR